MQWLNLHGETEEPMTRRIVDSKIRSSETFAGLTLRQRDLWHGLLVVVDDQGRMPANPAFVRAQVWPFDDFTLADIDADLHALEDAGNILRYQADGRTFLQIVNWWRYQAPQWCNSSDHPAPAGWIDRVRVHRPGGKIETLNWDLPGGISGQGNKQGSQLPNPQGSAQDTSQLDRQGSQLNDVNVNVNGDVNATPLPSFDHPAGDLAEFSAEFANTAGLPELVGGSAPYTKALKEIKEAGAEPGDITRAVQILRDKEFTISGPWSLVNTVRGLVGQRNGAVKSGKNGGASGHYAPPGVRTRTMYGPDGSTIEVPE